MEHTDRTNGMLAIQRQEKKCWSTKQKLTEATIHGHLYNSQT